MLPSGAANPRVHITMLSEGLIVAMIVSASLSMMGIWKRSQPLIFMSSLGWMISALQIFQQTSELLPMGLMLMLSVGQFIVCKGD